MATTSIIKQTSDIGKNTDVWATSTYNLLETEDEDNESKILAMARISALAFNSNGESVNDINIVSDLEPGFPENKYGVNSVYEELYEQLERNYEDLYEIRFFNYDWRYSNAVSAESLATFINENGYDKVVLIAHSMGGLVVSKFLANAESPNSIMGQKVENCLFIGSPLLGSPITAYIVGSEDISSLADMEISEELLDDYYWLAFFSSDHIQIKNLLKNIPSLYETLPSEMYFESYDVDEVINENDNDNDNIQYNYYLYSDLNSPYSTMQATNNELKTQIGHFSASLIDEAVLFHNSLWTNIGNQKTHISQDFSSYYLAGYDISMSIQYNDSWSVLENTVFSDRMVPVRSATLGIINTENVFYQKDVDHNELLHSSATLELIDRIMNHKTTTGINGMEARPYENQES